MMRVSRALLISALCATALLWPWLAGPAAAAPLEPATCETFKTEYDGLVTAGAKSDMTQGPEWARLNLPAERLQKIERLIVLEEQLTFRCGLQLTARPYIKEPPKPQDDKKQAKGTAKPEDDLFSALGLSPIPPPKKKQAAPVKAK
jgi:hypothetical protein